jgi:hypothetical protein
MTRKILSLFLIMTVTVSTAAFAGLNTSSKTSTTKTSVTKTTASVSVSTDALTRLEQLGIMTKLDTDKNDIYKNMTREDFAKSLVSMLDLGDISDSLVFQSAFSDVKVSDKYIGYINTAVSKGYLSGMADKKFHPTDSVTYAQFCTAIVKALGYTDSDLTGVWPQNYISKAKALKLTAGISLKTGDGIPRWIAATMLDRLQNTNIKKANAQDANKTLVNSIGLFTDCIILGNSGTNTELEENQIMTDLGAYFLNDTTQQLVIGNKYRVKITDNKIEKVYYSLKTIKKINVSNNNGLNVSYKENSKTLSLTLPTNVIYYYNGAKQNYSDLKNILQSNNTIIFAYNDDKIGYAYAVILDPIYSKPETALNVKAGATNIGDIKLEAGIKILKNGSYIDASQIMDGDLVYQVSTIDNAEKYIYVVDNKVEGKLKGILPNRLYPKTLQIDDKSYEISKDMDLRKLTDDSSIYKIEDTVQLLIGHDGKVADISKTIKVGKYSEYVVTGNSTINSSLQTNQILTDQGLLYLNDTNLKFTLGSKYRFYLSGGKVEKIDATLNKVKNIVVTNANDNKVTYSTDNKTETMTLPDNITYYYNGEKVNYSDAKSLLQVYTTLVFGYNESNTGFDYALVVDPVYSKPEIANNVKSGDKNIGSISLSDWSNIVRNGEYINPYDIENGEVVYQVSDLYNTNKYILVLDGTISGELTAILPSRVQPKIIQIDNKNYDISYNMDISKITSKSSNFKIGDTVQIATGYDNKVVNMDYPLGQDNANFAYVLNTTSVYSNGSTVYGAKLLKADGTTEQYVTTVDYSALKGTLVTFKEIDENTVSLVSKTSTDYQDTVINKEDGKIGDYYVTSNVRIFNVVNNFNGLEANVKLITWDDLYSGTVQSTKIQFMNHVGDFNDVNVILVNDLYNEGTTYALVKSISVAKSGTSYNYVFNVAGKDYSYSTSDGYNHGALSVVSLGLYNNQVLSYDCSIASEIEATNIQAIDSTKIKLKDKIYKFRKDTMVYYINRLGEISTKLISEIDITKTYSSIRIYLDKSQTYGGKIKALVIAE